MYGTQPGAHDADVDLRQLWEALIRSWRKILAVAVLAMVAALAYVWLAAPHYQAATRVLIETRESVFTRAAAGAGELDRPILDEEGVTSQVELMGSGDLLRQVARELDLGSREEFAGRRSTIGQLLSLVGLRSEPSGFTAEERVVRRLREQLSIYRVERSRVIVVEFSSRDPDLAAAVPNAIADAYIEIQREAKLVSTADATEWLEPEIQDLRARVREAEARVASFRASSDLLLGQNNSVLTTQQLSEISSELSRVRAERSSAVARAEEVRAALDAGGTIDAIPEVLSSPLVQRLMERRVQLNADIAELSTNLLDNHPRLRSQRSQLADLDRQIRNEVAKVLQALESEARAAQRREQELTAELNQLKAASARAGEEEVELRALEREAAAQRELLESYLTRFREAMSRSERNYLPVDARIFARATAPSEPYFPRPVPIVGAAFAGTLLVMLILTLLGELFSGRAFRPASGRSFERVEDVAMPLAATALSETEEEHEVSQPEPAQLSPVAAGMTVEAAAERLIGQGAMRAVFVSPEGDEAVAASVMVAREVADSGLRVIFLDLTQSCAASVAMLESSVYSGITNLLCSQAQFTDVIHADLYSDCHVIPVGTADTERAMRAIDRLPIIMSSLTAAYDLVVVECGPANSEGLRRMIDEETVLFVGAIEPQDDSVVEATRDLEEGGFGEVRLVTPAGQLPPPAPDGRRAA